MKFELGAPSAFATRRTASTTRFGSKLTAGTAAATRPSDASSSTSPVPGLVGDLALSLRADRPWVGGVDSEEVQWVAVLL